MFDANETEVDDSWLNCPELDSVRVTVPACDGTTVPAPLHLPVTLWHSQVGDDTAMGYAEYMDWVREQNEILFGM